jgi:hypothetical protein
MARFLAIFNGAADEAALTDAQQTALMDAWARWAQADEPALADPGAPLNANKLVTARGVEDVTDAMTGYALVAGSHDEAVRIFADHPHLGLSAGNSIAVLQCPAPPG